LSELHFITITCVIFNSNLYNFISLQKGFIDNLRYFLSTLVLLLSCTTLPENIPGCTDSSACNFNINANEDDGSCAHVPDMCGICDNDPSNDCIQDCAGIFGGNTQQITCDNCMSNLGEFDCSGNCCINDLIYDINLLPTYESCSIEDKCGTCNGDGWNNGLSCDDLSSLQNIIDANDFSVTSSAQNQTEFHTWDLNSNGFIDPQEFGVQYWSDEGRLTNLKVDIPIVLTDDIGTLTELAVLILETNNLTSMPETIGDLQKLKIFSLTSNPISILPERIVELANLEELVISSNNILYLPENIGNLTNLKKLDVANNKLTTLPDNIGSLNQLTELLLENNQINVLPASFTDLSNLVELKLYSNKLAELPEGFWGFDNLIDLYLNDNLLSGLPDNFGTMDKLKRLRLNGNQLDSLTGSIGSLGNLEELWLQKNQLTRIPEEIGELNFLIILYLHDNQLEWLPDDLCNIYSGLEEFSANNNLLCNLTVPDCISYENDVGNQFCSTGGCPPHHFEREGYCVYESDYNILQNFLDLNPESQSLPAQTGIPNLASECVNDQWWDEGRLVEISFQHKKLSSEIPENFGDLDKLKILRLTDNQITGEIPENITNLINLKILKLNSNSLSGSIPENIGALSNLDSLYLSYNSLTGEIPSSITEIDSLTYLAFNNNMLTGIVPEQIGSIDSLKYLYFDQNLLSGEIPQSIGNLKNIKRLYLHTNQLSGLIPENICTIYDNNEYAQLMLEYNQFCPPYPDCIPEHHLGYDENNVIKQDTTNCNR